MSVSQGCVVCGRLYVYVCVSGVCCVRRYVCVSVSLCLRDGLGVRVVWCIVYCVSVCLCVVFVGLFGGLLALCLWSRYDPLWRGLWCVCGCVLVWLWLCDCGCVVGYGGCMPV